MLSPKSPALPAPPNPRNARIWFWGAMILAAAVFLTGVQGEFIFGHRGWCAARRSVAALNFLRYGFAETGFGPVENYGFVDPEQFQIYWHHPPGMHLLIGLANALFGIGEWQSRLAPFITTMIGAGLFFKMAFGWWRGPGRIAAVLFYISTPMLAFYGPFVAQETLTLTCGIALVFFWERWRTRPSWKTIGAASVLCFVAAWSDWPWFVMAFLLALFEIARLIATRSFNLRWLVPTSAGVIAGLVGVIAHLISLQRNTSAMDAFKGIFESRSGGEALKFNTLAMDMGERWIELFTPTLVIAGCAYAAVLLYDLARGRFPTHHILALICFITGAAWVVIFKQGASVHEYWPFFSAPFFIIAGADLIDRLWGLMGQTPSRTARTLALGVLGLLIATQTVAGFAGTIGRLQHPARGNPQESDDYRHAESVLGQWLNAHTDPHDRVLFQGQILHSHFQVGYYTDRAQRVFWPTDKTVRVPTRPGTGPRHDQWAAIDLRTLDPIAVNRVVTDLVQNHPVTRVDDFIVADLRRRVEKGAPEVRAVRIARRPAGLWHRWSTSMIYDPWSFEPDPLRAAELLWTTGHPEHAAERYASVESIPDDLSHRVTDYNLAFAMGLSPAPPATWVPDYLGLPENLDGPQDLGGRVTMLAAEGRGLWRLGVETEAVYQIDDILEERWRPFLHRVSAWGSNPEKRDISAPQRVWTYPTADTLLPGQLLHMRGHFGLHRHQRGVNIRWGFWWPGTKKRPPEILRTGGKDWIQTPITDEPQIAPLPWVLGWVDLQWLKDETL